MKKFKFFHRKLNIIPFNYFCNKYYRYRNNNLLQRRFEQHKFRCSVHSQDYNSRNFRRKQGKKRPKVVVGA